MKIDERGIKVQSDFTVVLFDSQKITVEARDERAALKKALGTRDSVDDYAITPQYGPYSCVYRVFMDGKTIFIGEIKREVQQ